MSHEEPEQRFAGVVVPEPEFADDDGSADPRLAEVLAAYEGKNLILKLGGPFVALAGREGDVIPSWHSCGCGARTASESSR